MGLWAGREDTSLGACVAVAVCRAWVCSLCCGWGCLAGRCACRVVGCWVVLVLVSACGDLVGLAGWRRRASGGEEKVGGKLLLCYS